MSMLKIASKAFVTRLYGGPQGQYKNISSSTIISNTVQQYVFQDKKIHSSTTIYIPVQQYVFQYNNIYPSTKIFILVQKDVYSSTDIYFHSGTEL